jgi:transcriptional regulator with XRE-family HTH domain
LAFATPKFYFAGSKKSRKSGFLRAIGRKNQHSKQALLGTNVTEFGKLCRNYRTNKGLNMTRAAELTGKSQATLTNYETGKEAPTFEFIKTSMEVYGITNRAEQMRFLLAALNSSGKIEMPLIPLGRIRKEWLAALYTLGNVKEFDPTGWEELLTWLDNFVIRLKKRKPLFHTLCEPNPI